MGKEMVYRDKSTSWQPAAQSYLLRLSLAEYKKQLEIHLKKGRIEKTFRFNPSRYHRDLVELLGRNDEEGFKRLKTLTGYSQILGV